MNIADQPLNGSLDEPEDPRVLRAVQEYLADLESGRRPNRSDVLARYPDVADSINDCLDALEFVRHAAPTLGDRAPVEPSAAAVPDLATPLGDFRLLREIGRGGMGVVYEAEQLSLGRRIALKVLPFALTLDERQLRRFKNEAQAAAHLHHSHIVPVYSVGCERGVHFYAMQYIEGRSLAAVIQELRQLPRPATATVAAARTAPDENGALQDGFQQGPLDSRSVARLGVQAAEALEHAHQMGVIHRDVKPANLLVDTRGHLWVTDFGLAQVHNDTSLTVSGDLLGTLRYMSPEQARARRGLVDHRTDIWSLGVTLYELLTLEPAFASQDRHELLEQITSQEPIPPRRRNPAIPADLETIVLKAMSKAVEDRYGTAQELADDLRRFLDHRPILARRPSLVERAGKWARRHRPLVTAAVAGLLLAVVGLGISTALVLREQARTQAAYDLLAAEQERTRAAYEAEAQQRARAEESFRQARQAVDFFTRLSDEELRDRPQLQEVRRKLLQGSLSYYQSFLEQRQDDPTLQEELAASQFRVANILQEIGSKTDAQAALAQARLLEETFRGDRTPFGRGRPPGPRGPGMDAGVMMLLAHKAVQEDLKLTEEQVKTVAQLAAKRREAYWEFRGRPEDERQQFQELAAREKALVEGLRPEQVRRLEQIVLQQRGPFALADAEVAEALQLTAEQKEKMRSLLDEAFRGLRAPLSFKKAADQLLDVLTTEQKTAWKALQGEPFKGDLWPLPPGGFGPGRGPGIRGRP